MSFFLRDTALAHFVTRFTGIRNPITWSFHIFIDVVEGLRLPFGQASKFGSQGTNLESFFPLAFILSITQSRDELLLYGAATLM
jgi:hypothetical protein